MTDPGATYSASQAHDFHRQMTLRNWSDGGELMQYTFLHLPEFFPHAVIQRSGPVSELEYNLRDDVAGFSTITGLGALPLVEYVEQAPVNGLIILHRGRIVFEQYPGMREFDIHNHMSVSKIFASTAIAILEDRGLIDVEQPVDEYLPELAGSGWDGVRVIDVLDMASGIDCPEVELDDAHSNPEHAYYHYEASFGWYQPTDQTLDSPYDYMPALKRGKAPGTVYEYTSVNTFILSWLAERLTGLPYAEIVREEIWSKIGAESAAFLAVSPTTNAPASHAGFSTTLRDLARVGLLFTSGGRAVTNPVVSDRYLARITRGGRPKVFQARPDLATLTGRLGELPSHNSYQWDWVMHDGDFFKSGYGGQGLYISPDRDLVIAFFGVPKEGDIPYEQPIISRQLSTSGLFA